MAADHKMAEDSGGIQDMELMVMDHSLTFMHEEWKVSRELAEEMFRTIPGLHDNYQLDQITMGDGQCFHTSVHQQLRRPEVQNNLSPRNKQLSRNSDMKAFKSVVRRFMMKNKHPVVDRMKEDFEIFMQGVSWDNYWCNKNLLRKEFWADEVFLRSTAWFLQLDIVLHQNVPGYPEKTISGNIEDENVPCNGPKLHLGYLLNRHYQSIIPRVNVSSEFETDIQKHEDKRDNDESNDVCPVCKKKFPQVLSHIKRAKHCKSMATIQQIKDLEQISLEKKKQNKKKRKPNDDLEKVREDNKRRKEAQRNKNPDKVRESDRRCKAAQKEKNPEMVKENNRKWKAAQKEKNPEMVKENDRKRKAVQKEKNPEKMKENDRKRKAAQKEKNPKKVKEDDRKQKAVQKAKNPQKMREDDKIKQQRHRLVLNEDQRLKLFLENTLFGPIFICLSCHQRHFKSNVQIFSPDSIKMPVERCIISMNPLKKMNFGQVVTCKKDETNENEKNDQNQFICKTCLGYLKKN